MFIVSEIQTSTNNQVTLLNYQFENMNEAESKYHTILAAAAMSNLPVHAAIIMTNEGIKVKSECFKHEVNE